MYITCLAWLRSRKARIQPTFVPFPVRVPASSHPLRPLRVSSRVVGATSAHRGLCRHVQFAPPSRITHTHTHTHTLSLSLSLPLSLSPPAVVRLTTADPPPSYSHRLISLSNSRADYPSAIYYEALTRNAHKATAPKGILERKPPQNCCKSTINLQPARTTLSEYNRSIGTDKTLWTGTCLKSVIRTRVHQLL